jgi:hypothetical protein
LPSSAPSRKVTRTSQEATVSTDRTPKNLDTLDRVEVDPPRVLSHERFQFNFNVSLGARVRAMFGAPSWSRRKKRLDDRLDRFWREQNERAEALWIAAGEGRIDDEGREIRQALLDGEGRDKHAARDRRAHLFRQRMDRDAAQLAEFNRAWKAHLTRLSLGDLTKRIEDYNRFFPVEADLPVDPATETFVWMGSAWQPAELPDAAAVLARLPYR